MKEIPDQFDAIDPGVDYFARATFRGGQLDAVCIIQCDPFKLIRREGSTVVIERPLRKFKGVRESDQFRLACAAGEIAASYEHRVYLAPAEWKGQVPKDIHHKHHVLPALEPAELAILPKKKGELKHILDAVGIGLRYLGRRAGSHIAQRLWLNSAGKLEPL